MEAIRGKLNELNAALVGLAKVKEQLASCAAGPWVPFDRAKHKDGKIRLLRRDNRMTRTGSWDDDTNRWWQGVHEYSNPTHVAELREFKNTCANTKGEQSNGQ